MDIDLQLATAQGEVILEVAADDWRLIDDSSLAAETAEQAIADAGLDYRVVDVGGHLPGTATAPFTVPVVVERIGQASDPRPIPADYGRSMCEEGVCDCDDE